MVETEAIQQFREAMRAAGLEPPEVIEPGKLHRFSTNGKASDNAGWCKLFSDLLGGVFGDYRTGLSEKWQAKRNKPFTRAEREAFKRQCEQAKQERQAEQDRQHAEAAKHVESLLDAAQDDPKDHPYPRGGKNVSLVSL
jgi:putative DNA primase/helicase